MIDFKKSEQRWRGRVYVDGKRIYVKSSKNREVVEEAVKEFIKLQNKRVSREEYLKKVYG